MITGDIPCCAPGACRFQRDVVEKDLTGIVVPEVYHATHEVLITEWIEGGPGRWCLAACGLYCRLHTVCIGR